MTKLDDLEKAFLEKGRELHEHTIMCSECRVVEFDCIKACRVAFKLSMEAIRIHREIDRMRAA